jgi:hypothetical protein
MRSQSAGELATSTETTMPVADIRKCAPRPQAGAREAKAESLEGMPGRGRKSVRRRRAFLYRLPRPLRLGTELHS